LQAKRSQRLAWIILAGSPDGEQELELAAGESVTVTGVRGAGGE